LKERRSHNYLYTLHGRKKTNIKIRPEKKKEGGDEAWKLQRGDDREKKKEPEIIAILHQINNTE